MLDSTIEALRNALASRFPSVTRRDKHEIETGDLPPSISSFLVLHLERKAREELGQLDFAGLRWIDIDHANVRQCLDALAHEANEHAVVPKDEWDQCLREATRFTVEATIDPRTALVKLVFGDDEAQVPADHLISRLRRFDAHPPLRDAVADSLQRRPEDTYSRERFQSIVAKVDDLRTDGFTANDWLDELSIVCELLAEVGLPKALPAEQIAAFLAAQRCGSEARVVATAGREHITPEEAKDLIEAASPTEEPEDNLSEAQKSAPQEWSLFSQAVESGGAERERDPASVPLWKRFQKDFNAPMGSITREDRPEDRSTPPDPTTDAKAPSPDRVARPKPVTQDSDEHGERSQRPLWQQYRSSKPGSKTDNSQAPDLQELELGVLGPDAARGRGSFIDDLFGGDEKAYLDAMDELSHANTWSEASQVIADRVFKRYKVNIYSEPAVAFTNAVEARYRARRVNA